MSRVCRNMEDSGKHRFHGLEHDSKMRLLKSYSHTSTLRGHEASRKILKQKRPREQNLSRRKKNVSERATYKTQFVRVEWTYRASPCGGDVLTGWNITRKSPPGKLNEKPRTKTNIPRKSKFQNRENRIKYSRAVVA